jgi:nucleoside-diphosphate-sugar epimerase
MKILVTGATGFIGAAVARKLSQRRHQVLALARSDAAAAKLRVAGLTPVAGDFAVPASLAAPAAQVDAIVSTASIGQVEGTPDSFAKDRDAIAVMTKALGDSGKPFIFTRSMLQFAYCPARSCPSQTRSNGYVCGRGTPALSNTRPRSFARSIRASSGRTMTPWNSLTAKLFF